MINKKVLEIQEKILHQVNKINSLVSVQEDMDRMHRALESASLLGPAAVSSLVSVQEDMDRMHRALESASLGSTMINNSLLDIQNSLNQLSQIRYNNIAEFISRINFNPIILEYEKRFLNKYNLEFDNFIKEHNWIIPSSPSQNFIDSLYNAFENGEDIDKIFIEYFSENNYENIMYYLDKWTSDDCIPESNLNIINSVITLTSEGISENHSDVLIPPLLAQIDVLISQVLIVYGFEKMGRRYYHEDYSSTKKGNTKAFREDLAINIIDGWDEHQVKFLLDSLFTTTDKKTDKEISLLTFNRHRIMHGLDCDYGIFENLIRCILIIDFLNDFLSSEAEIRLN